MKKILILNGHPDSESLNHALSEAYIAGAIENHPKLQAERIDIGKLAFDPNLKFGYRTSQQLEPDLQRAIEKIKDADHLVWFFPTWWQGFPAIMKGFIDRVFLPGIAYKFEKGKILQKKLLKNKSARIIVTSDTPGWYNRIFLGRPAINQMKKAVLQFCGVSPVKVTHFRIVRKSDDKTRQKWFDQVRKLGENLL
ncbi:MAG: NAD(P)H-dependent oxidoreductase [Bacteroidota bacterium]